MKKPKLNPFEKWVMRNCTNEGALAEPPSDWNREEEFFYIVGNMQYRVPIKKVPRKFIGIVSLANATGSKHDLDEVEKFRQPRRPQ
jgi:hypothetical protein